MSTLVGWQRWSKETRFLGIISVGAKHSGSKYRGKTNNLYTGMLRPDWGSRVVSKQETGARNRVSIRVVGWVAKMV